jgi:hypothetical protein
MKLTRPALLTTAALTALAPLAACGSSSGAAQDGDGIHGTVSGTVRAADGTGVPGCSVIPELVEGDTGVPEKIVVSQEGGSYTWPLPPGTYNFTVRCESGGEPAVPDGYDGLTANASHVQVASGGTETLDFDLS